MTIEVVLGLILLNAVIIIYATYTENSQERADRSEFLFFVGILIALEVILRVVFPEGLTASNIILCLAVFYNYPISRLMVRRARDAGLGKLIVYLSIIPIPYVPIACWFVLLLKPTVRSEADIAANKPKIDLSKWK